MQLAYRGTRGSALFGMDATESQINEIYYVMPGIKGKDLCPAYR